jgi:hypothetical protein
LSNPTPSNPTSTLVTGSVKWRLQHKNASLIEEHLPFEARLAERGEIERRLPARGHRIGEREIFFASCPRIGQRREIADRIGRFLKQKGHTAEV